MGIRIKERTDETGNVLFITLAITGILGATLGSYLCWLQNQNLLSAHSEAWNAAIATAEAGVEEALSQINANYGTNYVPYTKLSWGMSGNVYGPHTNTLRSGSYSVIISNDFPPTIYSSGTVTAPLTGTPITRTVRVATKVAPAFAYAMAALQNIEFNGNNIAVDSFDSSQPGVHATLTGMYDYATRLAGGDVASTYGAIDIGNGNINGKVRTSPLVGEPSVGPNGFAGDLNWTGPGIQKGWWQNDFNMDFPDVTVDTGGWFEAVPESKGSTNKYVLGNGNYIINGDLLLNAGEVVLVQGVVNLFVNGNVLMKGAGANSSQILMGELGSRLTLYVAGPSAALTQINVDASGANASAFRYFGLPGNTSVSWSGNAAYLGLVYAPSAIFTLSGSGDPKNPTDYQGSCIVNQVVMNGHFKFHYDESLQRIGPFTGFKPVSWSEL